MPSLAGRACGAADRHARGGAEPISRQAGALHRRLHRRQRDRHHGADVRAEIPGGLGRPGDGRERAGRRRQRRRRPGGEVRAGRHDLLLGRQRRADHQPDAAGQPDLRRGARPCAGGAAAGDAEHPRRQQRRAGEELCRFRRAGEGAARQAVLRVARRRHAAAHRRRTAQEPGRHRHRPCALSRRGVHRRDRRPRDDDLAEHGRDPAGGAPGPVARACRHLAEAHADHAGAADGRGIRPAGLRGDLLVRADGAGRHAGADHQQGLSAGRQDRDRARDEGQARAARPRRHQRCAGRLRRDHQGGHRQMGEGDQGRQYQGWAD